MTEVQDRVGTSDLCLCRLLCDLRFRPFCPDRVVSDAEGRWPSEARSVLPGCDCTGTYDPLEV